MAGAVTRTVTRAATRTTARTRSATALLLVVAILFITAVASEIFVDDFLSTPGLFGYLLFTTLTAGVLATVVVERANIRILG